MTDKINRVILYVTPQGFLRCPKCKRNNRLLRITEDMVACNLPLFCSSCKRETYVDIAEGIVYKSQCPVRSAPETKG